MCRSPPDVFDQVDSRLGSIQIPAVVIQGEQDKLVAPKYGRKIAAAMPDARLEMVHGGHMAPYTHPYTVAAAVGEVERSSRSKTAQPAPRTKGAGSAAQAATGTPSTSRSG